MEAQEQDPIAKKSEQLKGMSLLRNIHKITPQLQADADKDNVAIIKALKSDSLVTETILQLEGKMFDPLSREYVEFRNAVMNKKGIGNFIMVIGSIAKTIEFSSFREKEIPKIAKYLFKMNYPYFTIYYSEYDLDRSDFNLIANLLFTFIISSLNKAKGSGHRNVVRGTYSEDLLGRYVGKEEDEKKKGRLDLSKLNPFKRSKAF